jgi:glutamyl-tRNA synthetase
MMHNTRVVTRFAPSPTGFMHVGSVRTALFAYLYAKQNNGDFILRIEDTDKKREVEGSIEHIIESLRWLNIDWNVGIDIGGPLPSYKQSERLDIYIEYAKKLLAKGLAYQDPFSEEELEMLREKAKLEKRPFLFRDHRPEDSVEWDVGKTLRFKTPIKKYAWNDAVRGDLSAGEEALDDFVLIKSDGFPTYNFCHIIDDFEMVVTHIMRADEFIASTPKYLALYEALEITPPIFVTLPPIMGVEGGKKLGKRDGAKDILDYKKEGYLPSAIINYLALLGWNPGTEQEIFTIEELQKYFDIEKIQKSGARWDDEKLLWINREHLKRVSIQDNYIEVKKQIDDCGMHLPELNEERLAKALHSIIDRIDVYSDIRRLLEEGEFVYFFKKPGIESKEILFWKKSPDSISTLKHLEHTLTLLEDTHSEHFDSITNLQTVLETATSTYGKGEILWPLRVALSGREKSVDPFTLLYVLGKEESVARINSAVNVLNK